MARHSWLLQQFFPHVSTCVCQNVLISHMREEKKNWKTPQKLWGIYRMFSKSSHGFGTRCLDFLDCLGIKLMVVSQTDGAGESTRNSFIMASTKDPIQLSVESWRCFNAEVASSLCRWMQSRNMGRLNLLLQWRSCLPATANENQLWTKPTRRMGCLCSWECCCSSRTILWSHTTHGAWYL